MVTWHLLVSNEEASPTHTKRPEIMRFKSLVKPCLVEYFPVVAKGQRAGKADHKERLSSKGHWVQSTGLATTLSLVQE